MGLLNLDKFDFTELVLNLQQNKSFRDSVRKSIKDYDAEKNNDSDISSLLASIKTVGDLSLLIRNLNPTNKDIQAKLLQMSLDRPEFKKNITLGDLKVLCRDFPECHQEIETQIKILALPTSNPQLHRDFAFDKQDPKTKTPAQEAEPRPLNSSPSI